MISGTVIGNVGKVELKTVGQGTQALNFSVASNRKRGDRESTTWVSCSWFGERAAKVAAYINKGDQIAVTGTLYEREWESSNGKGKSLEMDVTDVKLLGGKKDGAGAGAQNGGATRAAAGAGQGADDLPF